MISVLIPVYNYDVTELVSSIHTQLIVENIQFEIICIDDFSTVLYPENEKLNLLPNVRFYKLPNNIGRSKIRNLLSQKAIFDWLLFLDADVFPKNKFFISEYLKCIQLNEAKVYCGGIIYQNNKPQSKKMLRWVYGKKREEISVEIRKINPYHYFFGGNFLVQKSIFNEFKFNENFIKYGYEDVFFAEDLRINNIKLRQVEILAYHFGIDDNSVFIAKTKQAIENLYVFGLKDELIGNHVKLLSTFNKMYFYKITWVYNIIYLAVNKLLEYNLKSNTPSLFIFDIYKLGYFCFLFHKNKAL